MDGVSPLNKPTSGDWQPLSDEQALTLEAAAWLARPELELDPGRNRQFLSTFAIYLVKGFRVEEDALRRMRARCLKERLVENHRLALHLRDLMENLEQGQDVTEGIGSFLREWHHLRERGKARWANGPSLEH